MYIETSAPRVRGDKAWLFSQPFNSFTGSRCMVFWYHMYGRGIGKCLLDLKFCFLIFTAVKDSKSACLHFSI